MSEALVDLGIPSKPYKEIGDRLYEVRTRLRLNKKEFAESIGKSPVTYSRYEDGTRGDLGTIQEVCRVHRVSADWLINGIGKMLHDDQLEGDSRSAEQVLSYLKSLQPTEFIRFFHLASEKATSNGVP